MRNDSIIFGCLIFLSAGCLVSSAEAQQTPASFSLVSLPDFEGNDGSSEEKALRGTAVTLMLNIEDDTPSIYSWGGYQVSRVGGDGSLCQPIQFHQFFETENQRFFLKFPLVLSGTVLIRVTGSAQEGGFPVEAVALDLYIAQHPNGCTEEAVPMIQDFSANNGASNAPVGREIRLSAHASGSDDSLVFFFFASSSALQRGSPLRNVTGAGCTSGCTANLVTLAGSYPASRFFTVEVHDPEGRRARRTLHLDIVLEGGVDPIEDIPALDSDGLMLLMAVLGALGAYLAGGKSFSPKRQ